MGIALDPSPTDASPIDSAALQANVRRARRRANVLLSLIILEGFCYSAWVGTNAIKVYLLRRGLPIVSTSEDEIAPIELVEGLVAIPSLLIVIPALVLWFFWLHRAYENLRLVGLRTTTYSKRWAIGCWFVPFANFFLPYRVVVDLTLRSEDANTWDYNEEASGPPRVLAWWLLTLVTNGLDRIVFRAPLELSAMALTLLDMASNAGSLVWAAMAFLIVRQIRDAQDRWPSTVESRLAGAG
jgi:hypothetical protein